jgi:hypothetical protein
VQSNCTHRCVYNNNHINNIHTHTHNCPCAAPGNQLLAARSEAALLDRELNATMQQLEGVSAELCRLLGFPQAWLLTAAQERAAYDAVDAAANDQYWR